MQWSALIWNEMPSERDLHSGLLFSKVELPARGMCTSMCGEKIEYRKEKRGRKEGMRRTGRCRR